MSLEENYFIKFIYVNRKIILAGIIGLIGSFLSWHGFQWYSLYQQKNTEEKIYQFRTSLAKNEKKHGGNILDPQALFFSKEKVKDYSLISNEVKNYVQFLLSEEDVNSAHWVSSIELAYFLIHYGKEKEALNLLDTISTKKSSSSWVYQSMLIKLATLFMNEKNYTRAVNTLSYILEKKEASNFYVEALLKTALSYQALKDFKSAEKIYSLIQNNSDFYKERALQYHRLMLLEKNINKK